MTQPKGYALDNHPTVQAIGQLHIVGNIVPPEWFAHILLDGGKPDLIGILLLAEIIYWYRPIQVRDETTGRVTGYRKKFRDDQMQRTYEEFGSQLGVTKRQARDALHRLKDAGLITIEMRKVKLKNGTVLNNVTYFSPIPEAVAKLQEIKANVRPITSKRRRSYVSKEEAIPQDVGLSTESTTEITPESTDKSLAATSAAHSDHKTLMTFLFEKFGPIPNPGAQGAAVKWLLANGYSVAECTQCFDDFMTDPYRAERVSWLMVRTDIGKWKKRNERPQQTDRPNGFAQERGRTNYGKPSRTDIIAGYDYSIFDAPAEAPNGYDGEIPPANGSGKGATTW